MKNSLAAKKLILEIRKKWKPRKAASHKGDYGRVFILAGSQGFTGAAHLSAAGALRAGAGLVTLGVPEKIYTVVARREAEVMVRPFPATSKGTLAFRGLKSLLAFLKTQDVLAIGPGLSQHSETQKLVRKLMSEIQIPVVIDADGLNALVGHSGLLKRCCRAVLTPHPGEFMRLFGGKLLTEDQARKARALEISARFDVIIVLKGHHTVIADPDGRAYLNPSGNPGMATGGTGDVLTGIIAALIGQKWPLLEASRFGVFLHGVAGDLAAEKVGQVSLAAGDLLNFLPPALRLILGKGQY